MQIYFLGSISALDKCASQYLKIIEILETSQHKVWYEHIIKRKPGEKDYYPVKEDSDYHDLTVNRIKYSDAMFAEVSYPTVNVGYEIAFALSIGLPVYAFYKDDTELPTMFKGNSDPNFKKFAYNDSNLKDLINTALDEWDMNASDQIVLPVSPIIRRYLNWVSKKFGVSRSTYVRSLIENKMLKDREYKKSFL